MLHGKLWTTFGWQIQVNDKHQARSLRNFPMQANGAEMLRLACIFGSERGIKICAPIHDALLIEAKTQELPDVVVLMEDCMREASRIVLDGFELRTEAKIIPSPDRYFDPRCEKMWQVVNEISEEAGICTTAQEPMQPCIPVNSY
jgi:hypothetical protein